MYGASFRAAGSREEIVKLYYDYSGNPGNGAPPGTELLVLRLRSALVERPWPPASKDGAFTTDRELGLE